MNDAALASVERQLVRDAMFTHTALGRNSMRISEVESFTYGLIDVLLAKGLVSQEEVGRAAEHVRSEAEGKGEAAGPGVALRMDAEVSQESTVTVNCAERMPVCHSICCKLGFALTAAEVEAGQIRWDLGRPYQIRHEASGFCVHRDAETGFCGAYEARPGICRAYSCAHDKRIWKDFERMELNREWLDANLSGNTQPYLAEARLYRIVPAGTGS
jgi:hypothetical protein